MSAFELFHMAACMIVVGGVSVWLVYASRPQ
jgi:hypothetical protein